MAVYDKRSRSTGFAQQPIFLLLVLAVCVAGFLAYQFWQANSVATPGDATIADSDSAAVSSDRFDPNDASSPHVLEGAPSSGDSGVQSFFATLSGEDDDATLPVTQQAFVVPQYSSAEHVEWVDTFYTQLYSPEQQTEVAPSEAEGAIPVISGRVLAQHGMPVEGIGVTAVFRDYVKTAESIARRKAVGTQTTTTNADGFYAFRGLPAGIYLVGTQESERYPSSRVEAQTGVEYVDLILKARRFVNVRGSVTDSMGTLLPQVEIRPLVRSFPEETVSDRNGNFEFVAALEDDANSFVVRFAQQGFREQTYTMAQADWAGSGSVQFAAELARADESSTLSGTVKDADGVPVGGEIVRLYSPSLRRNYQTLADDGGEFEFAAVEIAHDYKLWVKPSGPYRDFAEHRVTLMPGAARRDIKLDSLEMAERVAGKILDQHGRPVPNLTLRLRSDRATGQELIVTSDSHGNFEVENVPEGELTFETRTMPHYKVSGLPLHGHDKQQKLELVVNRGRHKLLGKVVNSDGRPVATQQIHITSSQLNNGVRSRSSSTTSANADGRFVFTDLAPGEHLVKVNAPGYEGARLRQEIGERGEELIVRLERRPADRLAAADL